MFALPNKGFTDLIYKNYFIEIELGFGIFLRGGAETFFRTNSHHPSLVLINSPNAQPEKISSNFWSRMFYFNCADRMEWLFGGFSNAVF